MSSKHLPLIRSLSLMGSLLAAGCASGDPVWDMPCSSRPKQEVQVGTGEVEFLPPDKGSIPIQNGSQGGQHIWMAMRLHGFGPEASMHFGIYDAAEPEILYSGPLSQHAMLEYNAEAEASEVKGLYGYLNYLLDPETQMPHAGPSGKDVILWADVFDECTDGVVHGESQGKVQ